MFGFYILYTLYIRVYLVVDRLPKQPSQRGINSFDLSATYLSVLISGSSGRPRSQIRSHFADNIATMAPHSKPPEAPEFQEPTAKEHSEISTTTEATGICKFSS